MEVFVNGSSSRKGSTAITPWPRPSCVAKSDVGEPLGGFSARLTNVMPSGYRPEDMINALWRDALDCTFRRPAGQPDAAAASRPLCHPFPKHRPVSFGPGRHVDTVCHLSRHDRREAVVIFLPGALGGVGPCRAADRDYDEDALYPVLAEELSQTLPVDCYRMSWGSALPDVDEMATGVCRVTLQALAAARSSEVLRVVLVGHSFGGAVACVAAVKLREMLAGTGAQLAGIVGLSPQAFGARKAAAELQGVPQLFVHCMDDEVVDVDCSLCLHASAMEPKELALLSSGGHNFDARQQELHSLLRRWIATQAELGEVMSSL